MFQMVTFCVGYFSAIVARVIFTKLALYPPHNPRSEVTTINNTKVALVFGREKTGLTNEELLHCHYHVMIPSNPEYSSLNLAAAVQVLCYELRVCALTESSHDKNKLNTPLATVDDIEKFYAHLETLLAQLGFLKKENPTLMPKVRRIFNRIQLEKPEINILRGMLTAVQRKEKLKLKELQALQQLS